MQFFVRYLLSRPHEKHFKILEFVDSNFFEEKCLIDAGANRGQTIQSFRLYSEAPVISFEPQENLVKYIKNRSMHNSEVLGCGLGKVKGEIEIFIPVYRGIIFDGLASTSELEARNFFKHDRFFFYNEHKLKVVKSNVEIQTLDSFKLNPAVLKIDVQGAELDVLEGAMETISNAQPIIFLERPKTHREIKFLSKFNYEGYIFKKNMLVKRNDGYNVIFLTKHHLSILSKKIWIKSD